MKKNYLIKPQNFDKIKNSLKFFNNISVKDLRNAENLDDLLPIIQEDLDNCILISPNWLFTNVKNLLFSLLKIN